MFPARSLCWLESHKSKERDRWSPFSRSTDSPEYPLKNSCEQRACGNFASVAMWRFSSAHGGLGSRQVGEHANRWAGSLSSKPERKRSEEIESLWATSRGWSGGPDIKEAEKWPIKRASVFWRWAVLPVLPESGLHPVIVHLNPQKENRSYFDLDVTGPVRKWRRTVEPGIKICAWGQNWPERVAPICWVLDKSENNRNSSYPFRVQHCGSNDKDR